MKNLTIFMLTIPLMCMPTVAFAGKWENFGGGPDNNRHAKAEYEIGVDNVGALHVAWQYDAHAGISATPTVSGGKVYVPDWAGNLHRIDAKTGVVEWSTTIEALTLVEDDLSRTSPAIQGNKLVIGNRAIGGGARIIAVNSNTGAALWSTSLDMHDAAIITQSPTIFGDTVFAGVSSLEELTAVEPNNDCCTFRGSVAALDLKTGKVRWQTFMAPQFGGFTGNAVWGSSPAVDPSRRLVFVSTGNNYTLPDPLVSCLDVAHDPEEDQACLDNYDDPDNLFDAIVALDMDTGDVVWAYKTLNFDAWNIACSLAFGDDEPPAPCPIPFGPDYDFGQAPMLWEADGQAFVGAGQKSGVFWALDRDTGEFLWNTVVGPGGDVGGMQWGSTTDGERIYVGISNFKFDEDDQQPYRLKDGTWTRGGSWSALDAATGEILWQTADPGCKDPDDPCVAPSSIQAPLSLANGLLFGASTAGGLHVLSAETGAILKSFPTGLPNLGGAAVVDGTVFWGSGYAQAGPFGSLYAFRP